MNGGWGGGGVLFHDWGWVCGLGQPGSTTATVCCVFLDRGVIRRALQLMVIMCGNGWRGGWGWGWLGRAGASQPAPPAGGTVMQFGRSANSDYWSCFIIIRAPAAAGEGEVEVSLRGVKSQRWN